MSSKHKEEPKIPADGIIRDVKGNASYKKGKFLGKGGFARVYELTCTRTGCVYAGKIVPKVLLQKPHQKQKMYQEITIHRSLNHKYIVQFHSHFEDENNVYIVLELCPKRTLMELHRRRKTVTEPEARYFMHQMCESLKYLHENNVVHRDLKLGNLLLNEKLEVKISDFGLAAKITKPGDRKMTMCGTPNYIAPEVLMKKGHSYEVDIWALGCILYTLLVGKPPFETETLNETYARIKKNKYVIPASLEQNCPSAADLIKHMLRDDPLQRPTIAQIYASPFLNEYRPMTLPSSCLTMAPRCDTVSLMNQTALYGPPLAQAHSAVVAAPYPSLQGLSQQNRFVAPGEAGFAKPTVLPTAQAREKENARMAVAVAKGQESAVNGMARETQTHAAPAQIELLQQLQGQLHKLLGASPRVPFRAAEGSPYMDEAEDPALGPMLWVSKWVDYSDKYGLGYQLSDDSYGVLFNDKTRLILLPNGFDLHYVTRDWSESYYSIEEYPSALGKKVKLINYFKEYMNERLVKAGAKHAKTDGDALARYPFMLQWHRSNACILMMLRNGTIQMNYFDDHVKVILCPIMQAITYLPSNQEDLKTYSFSGIALHGATKDMHKRLKDAYLLTAKLIQMATAPSSASLPSGAGTGAVPATAK